MISISIFTPAYNRAYTLKELYNSLLLQDRNKFEWIVVNDGSTDNTEELIKSFIIEDKINIKYINTKNGGKHRAINKGVSIAEGELFFIVDSDDSLIPNAVTTIIDEWEKVKDKQKFAGLCFRRINKTNHSIIGNKFPYEKFDSNSFELTYIHKVNGDKAEIFRTEILKRFPFPEITNEKFIPEAYIWNKIALNQYKLRCIDKGIYLCEYLSDGLSLNFLRNLKKNPRGFSIYYKSLISNNQIPIWPYKIKAIIRLIQCFIFKL